MKIHERLAAALGTTPAAVRQVTGGFTSALTCVCDLPDRSSVFVKAAVDQQTATWLRNEHRVYSALKGDFMPGLFKWHDDADLPIMVLEDLTNAHWPQSLNDEEITLVRKCLADLAQQSPPPGLPSLASLRQDLAGWAVVEQNPRPFLDLGLCSQTWLEQALPVLTRADEAAPLAGTELLHFDVRCQNICFVGKRVVLVDWNWACVGNAEMELVHWLPNLRVAGGPLPQTIHKGNPDLVALMAGYWAARAGLPAPSPNSLLRQTQKRQLEVALTWAAELLALPAPLSKAA